MSVFCRRILCSKLFICGNAFSEELYPVIKIGQVTASQAGQVNLGFSRPSRVMMWQSPVFLDLVIVNSLRIIRAYIKLGQRKLARVQVFQVTGHCSCIRVCRWPECSHICVLTQAGLRLNCRTYMSGQALQFRFNVNAETRVVSEQV